MARRINKSGSSGGVSRSGGSSSVRRSGGSSSSGGGGVSLKGVGKRVLNPVNFVLDTVSGPSFAVGNAIAGKPYRALAGASAIPVGLAETATGPLIGAGRNAVSIARGKGFQKSYFLPYSGTRALNDATERRSPSVALDEKGVEFHGGLLGFVERVGIDVALDPLTYSTFGFGAARTGARAAAAQAARKKASQQIKSFATTQGRKPTLDEVGRIMAPVRIAEREIPKTFKVGLRVPFTRSKDIPLFESSGRTRAALGSAGSALSRTPLPSAIKGPGSSAVRGFKETLDRATRVIQPGGKKGAVNDIYQDVRRAGEAEGAEWNLRVRALNTSLDKLERATKGAKRGDIARQVSLHLSDPAKNALPEGAGDIATQARQMLKEIDEVEAAAGVDRGATAQGPVPLLLKGEKSRRAFQKKYTSATPDEAGNPFLVNAEQFPSLKHFVDRGTADGFDAELNIAKLIEARANASINVRTVRAVNDSVAGQVGRNRAPSNLRTIGSLSPTRGALARGAQRGRTDKPIPEVNPNPLVDDQLSLGIERQVGADVVGETTAARNAVRNFATGRAIPESGISRDVSRATDEASRTNLAKRKKTVPGTLVAEAEYQDLLKTWEKMGTATKFPDGTLIPKNIKEQLDAVYDTITPTMSSTSELAAVGRFLARSTARWKALALSTTGFVMRNLQDDMLRAYWAGARNPASFQQGWSIVRHAQRKSLGKETRGVADRRAIEDAGAKVTIPKGDLAGTYDADEFMRIAESFGVARIGFVKQDIGSVLDERIIGAGKRIPGIKREVFAPGQGRVSRSISRIEGYREDATRVGLFIELLKRGDDPIQAAATVRRYLFDYGEVGAFVAGARRFWMPFITFPSKALPQTIAHLGRRPGTFANINAGIKELERQSGADLSDLSVGEASSIPIPAGALPGPVKSALGIQDNEDQTILFDPNRVTGFGTLNLLDARWNSARQNFLAGLLNPFVRASVEVPTGYSFFSGRLNPTTGVRAPGTVSAASKIPGVGAAVGFRSKDGEKPKKDSFTGEPIDAYSGRVNALLRTLPAFGQADQALGGSGSSRLPQARLFGGIQLSEYDRAKARYYAEKYGNR